MAVQFYDDKMLGDNFSAINKFNGDVLDILESLTSVAERNDARLKTLENIQLVIKAPKRSKLFLIGLVTLGVWAGYKTAEREFKKTSNTYWTTQTDKTDYLRDREAYREAYEEMQQYKKQSDNTTDSPEK